MAQAETMRAKPSPKLSGTVRAPGDKSISHRSLMLASMAPGESVIAGLLEGDDVLRTAAAMRALGASVERSVTPDGPKWSVVGANEWRPPEATLYFGNSGTGCRLALGAIAGRSVAAALDGDQSLRARPMARVTEPLAEQGAMVETADGRLPCRLSPAPLKAVDYELKTPSAQVKSAMLLAALSAPGETIIREAVLTRDHTERMLRAFGVEINFADLEQGRAIHLRGGQALIPQTIRVPGDPSSAAFFVAAAVIHPDADLTIEGVLMNPLRTGFFDTLIEMGAEISIENKRSATGEEIADIHARSSSLKGVAVPASRAASMIDEYPILAAVAAFASGDTYMSGVSELRVKETDRIAAMEKGLLAAGVKVETGADWMRVFGAGGPPSGDAVIKTHGDHRIGMAFLTLGLAAKADVAIDEPHMIATSFPGFADMMRSIGGDVR